MLLKNHIVLGIYSDPSAFAVELAVIETDGLDILALHQTHIVPYPHTLREQLVEFAIKKETNVAQFNQLNHEITNFFIQEISQLVQELHQKQIKVDVIALSGHSAIHNPKEKVHINFGNAETLANTLKIPVIHHFVKEDMNAGGVGAPLLTSFWATLCQDKEKPVALVALGALTRLVYIGPIGEQIGFDIAAGLFAVDRWVYKHTGQEMDFNGTLAAKGKADKRVIQALLKLPYLQKQPPKSAQREDFKNILEHVEGLSPADGAATLTTFIVESIIQAQQFLPQPPAQWIFIGGGTYNPTLMLQLKQKLKNTQSATQALPYTEGLNAMGFAFIGARYLSGLPISFPTTTGVLQPFSGGEITYPN